MGAPPSLLVILFLPPLLPGALLATPGRDDLAAALLACVVGGPPFDSSSATHPRVVSVLYAIWQLPHVADEVIRWSLTHLTFFLPYIYHVFIMCNIMRVIRTSKLIHCAMSTIGVLHLKAGQRFIYLLRSYVMVMRGCEVDVQIRFVVLFL